MPFALPALAIPKIIFNKTFQKILCGVILAGLLFWAYSNAISRAEKRGAQSVRDSINTQVIEKTAANNKLAAEIRRLNDENVRIISTRAKSVGVLGTGKASCTSTYATRPSGHVAAGGTVVAGLPGVPDPERIDLIGVPSDDAVRAAEINDLNRNEVLSWRKFYNEFSAAWLKKSGQQK